MKKRLIGAAISSAVFMSAAQAAFWDDGDSNTNWDGRAYNNMYNDAYGNVYSRGWGDGSMDSDMDGDVEITIKT